jgi:hypothetical protein
MSAQSIVVRLGAAALTAAFGAMPAMAACGDRPGTPTNVTARMTSESPPTVQVSWTNTASETVFWDVEMSTTARNLRQVFPLPAGIGRGDTGKGLSISNSYSIPAGTTRCFRVKARTARGTSGCVSALWSNTACVRSAVPATPAKPQAGLWGALAADGKGAWGYAVGYGTDTSAKSAALKGCGNRQCKLAVAGQARCYAYFESKAGGYWYGLALHTSLETAVSVARQGCTKGAPAGSCQLVKSGCAS